MIGGVHGKILHVDLETSLSRIEYPSEDVYRLLAGGRALIAYLLLRDLPTHCDALGPDNLLIFAPGILQGSHLPGTGRHSVGGKSPLTGVLGSSEAGGFWGVEFKRTGYDALVVHGQAKTPVYLWIHEGEVEIRPAGDLWGQQTAPAHAAICSELGDQKIHIAQIGPAGENQVLYSSIMHDINRAAGRNGLGAVMGSKKLKAVVVRGSMETLVVDPKRVGVVTRWFGKNCKNLMSWAGMGIGRGTQDSLAGFAYMGGLPAYNFGSPTFENFQKLSGEYIYEKFFFERNTCRACPVKCKQGFKNESEIPDQQLNPIYGGAEYEGMAAFGSCCGIDDTLAVLKANELANAYGLDTISMGMSIAFVMECFKNGVITKNDTGGIEFRWGDGQILAQAVKMTAQCEGFGKILAEGVSRMSARFGPKSAPFNLTIKNQEIPMHEPRMKHGFGVGLAVAPVGADHMMNMDDTFFTKSDGWIQRVNSSIESPISPMSPFILDEDKMQIFIREVNWRHFQDCSMICNFYCYDYHHLSEALSGVSGVQYSIHDVLNIGARAQTLARLFNIREGLTAADDRLPERVMKPFLIGPLAGVEITKDAFEWAKQRYYELMMWDKETGVPTKECLTLLGLDSL
jgi:aldehyde:ferredoxin oxidoreductase